MKKTLTSFLLALVMCLFLLSATASAAEPDLPDWYFLFAVFKHVDADCSDGKGVTQHTKCTMAQNEVDAVWDQAKEFEEYMNSVGVMRAHVDVVEIDTPVTELRGASTGSYLDAEHAALLMGDKVDLDKYDHVTCFVKLNVRTSYGALTGSAFENGTGHSCLNSTAVPSLLAGTYPWNPGYPLHEFLHFMERMSQKWGVDFGLHDIMENFYERVDGEYEACYTDILLNRAKGTAGTGVYPAAWQYPPSVLRTMTELNVPSGVTSIGSWAFAYNAELTRVIIPSGVTSIGGAAFQRCTSLTSMSLPASITRVEDYAFANCSSLTDVYYSGTEAQWKTIEIGTSNSALSRATIHYNHLLADVKTTDYFAQPVAWALEKGITTGTGNGKFSPGQNCTVAQILTFLWRANGSPKPAGSNPFSDVKSSDYYAGAAVWAYEKGIVSGGTFDGDKSCTRSMAVMYLWKAAGSPSAKAASFTDVPTGADYAQAVAWAMEKSVTAGTSTTTFSPGSVCTRKQIVTFLYRALAG